MAPDGTGRVHGATIKRPTLVELLKRPHESPFPDRAHKVPVRHSQAGGGGRFTETFTNLQEEGAGISAIFCANRSSLTGHSTAHDACRILT